MRNGTKMINIAYLLFPFPFGLFWNVKRLFKIWIKLSPNKSDSQTKRYWCRYTNVYVKSSENCIESQLKIWRTGSWCTIFTARQMDPKTRDSANLGQNVCPYWSTSYFFEARFYLKRSRRLGGTGRQGSKHCYRHHYSKFLSSVNFFLDFLIKQVQNVTYSSDLQPAFKAVLPTHSFSFSTDEFPFSLKKPWQNIV